MNVGPQTVVGKDLSRNGKKMEAKKYFFLIFLPSFFCLIEFMPISTPFPLRPIGQEEFAKIDYQVMRHAFASHNEMGRLCDEVIYQNDLAARLKMDGFGPIRTKVPVNVYHQDFSKTYFLDLVVGDCAVYELKTVAQLVPEHEAQLLNYLFLEGVHHGKLINFRPPKVEYRFSNTNLTHKTRRQCVLDLERWTEPTPESHKLQLIFFELLKDWGAFLELPLYLEALVHFLGGKDSVSQAVPLFRDGILLGTQRLHLLEPDIAFRITALTNDIAKFERELSSLLHHTSLRAIQWINMNHHTIQFITVSK